MALKYAIEVKGVTQLMMMKAVVLSGFDQLKIATYYEYRGKKIDHLPYSIEPDDLKPIYKKMNAWQEDLIQTTSVDQIPKALQ